ncbi:MAG TPA: hypothetical protein VGS80_09530, partial [Ktedonobacterales bacterium]|nr:hypothetical protein [Ktedonobacterales bacterium]
MKDPGEVADAMAVPLARLERAGRAGTLVLVIVTAVMTIIFIDRFVAAATALPDAWRTGLWWTFSGPAAIMLAVAPLNLIRPWAYVAAARRACKAVFTARAAAVAGDAELAPVASEQPDPQQSDHSASALAAIGPLRRSTGSRATTQLASCIALLVFGGLLTIATVAVLFTVPSGTTKSIGLLVLVGLTAGILGAALLLTLPTPKGGGCAGDVCGTPLRERLRGLPGPQT